MAPVAAALSPEDMADVAAFYANAREPFPKFTESDAASVARGKTLATVGNAEKGLQACANCHGPGGVGLAPAIPALAGQFAPYIEAQLKAWHDGERKNDGGEQMAVIGKRLDAQDFADLAAYFQQVQPSMAASASEAK
jgi:cytochrome c553